MLVKLDSPPWQENDADAAPGPRALPPAPADAMRAWSVAQTEEFLKRCDLQGAARAFADNGVNGIDLLGFADATVLMTDLNLTRFSARKVLAARDDFLEGRRNPFQLA